MLGRGIDQLLAHPGDGTLRERYVHDATEYVALAERRSGPIPRPVDDAWPWGDALAEIGRSRPGVLVLNLETSVTRSDDAAPGKGIHYRMSPDNLGALTAARPDVCVLANNHVGDFGRLGLEETLGRLAALDLRVAGAGLDRDAAEAPAVVAPNGMPAVSVLGCAHGSSGVPADWAAARGQPGVALLPDLSATGAARLTDRIAAEKDRGRLVVVSVHWGSNWGYDVPDAQVRFGHLLVDAGADVVHGHSAHHPRPLEVHRGRLVLHGCGDFVNDYEGIGGHDEYRSGLRLLHRVRLEPDGTLGGLELVPFRSRRLRLERAPSADVDWLADVLDRESRRFGVRLWRDGDLVRWQGPS
jgi:poly-gamma-glutamate synthesis protein (capsule biosynthesis protein)